MATKMTMRPIIIGSSLAETLQFMGTNFVLELMDDAAEENCPSGIGADWKTVADWIGYSGGELSQDQKTMIANGWTAYLAIGVAPSVKLQETFDNMAKTLQDTQFDRPPTEVMNVFDRLQDTDKEIRIKRSADIRNERVRLEEAFLAAKDTKKSWWRSLNPLTRKWIFATVVWMAIVFSYGYLFDPFDSGGWDSMDNVETNKLMAVAFLPFLGGLIYRAYRKWVV